MKQSEVRWQKIDEGLVYGEVGERGTVNMKVKHKQMRGITMGWT